MKRSMLKIGVVACVLALVVAGLSIAQPPAGGQQRDRGGDRGAPGDRGGRQFDPAQMRQMMTQRMKEQLGASDAEWTVIEPRLMKVMELSRQSGGMGGRGGMMFGGMRGRPGEEGRGPGAPGAAGADRGGRGQGPSADQMSPVEKANEQLRTTLQNESATPEQIKTALTNLRAAREKARTELATARQDLKQILTVRQEGQLVVMGLLE